MERTDLGPGTYTLWLSVAGDTVRHAVSFVSRQSTGATMEPRELRIWEIDSGNHLITAVAGTLNFPHLRVIVT